MNISFFISNPKGSGVIVDNSIIFSIQPKEFQEFSLWEQRFVQWYKDETEVGLLIIHVEGNNKSLDDSKDPTLDLPQEDLCREFMTMIYTENLPDTEFF
jgi:hypothetical protein